MSWGYHWRYLWRDEGELGFTKSEWSRLLSTAKKIIRTAEKGDVYVRVLDMNNDEIVINGIRGHRDTFVLERDPSEDQRRMQRDFQQAFAEMYPDEGTIGARGFCMTDSHPYGSVVESILAAAQKIAPDAFKSSSDSSRNLKRIFATMQRNSFNKYNAPELLAQLIEVLESEGLYDVSSVLRNHARKINQAWRTRREVAASRVARMYLAGPTAPERYQHHLRDVQNSIKALARALSKHKRDQARDPNNWGYVGDMNHVADDLKDIVEFMS